MVYARCTQRCKDRDSNTNMCFSSVLGSLIIANALEAHHNIPYEPFKLIIDDVGHLTKRLRNHELGSTAIVTWHNNVYKLSQEIWHNIS